MIPLKSLTPRLLKLLIIVAPVVLASIYYFVFATDRYVSESTVAIHQSSSDATALPGAAMALVGLSPPSLSETHIVRQYIHARALLEPLDAELGIRRHYESAGRDFLARLWPSEPRETFAEYYRRRVEVNVDDQSSTLTIRVQGFEPSFAQRLNRAILEHSERFVNEMSQKLAREKLAFAETELGRAGERLQMSKKEVLEFQRRNRLLDPTVQAQASGALVAEMQAGITKAEAELRSLRTYLNEDAYQIRALKAQIASTRAQLEIERGRATGSGRESARLGALTIEFQGLQMQADIALDAYKVALAAVENARIEATGKFKSLVVIEAPTLAESAEYPRRVYNLVTLLVGCLLLYGIVRLVIATISEHQD